MLAVSPLRSSNIDKDGEGNNREEDAMTMKTSLGIEGDGRPDFSGANSLLDSIDFDDLFMDMHVGDDLPDLEMDPELLTEFGAQKLQEAHISVSEDEGSNNGGVGEKGHVEGDSSSKGSSQVVEPVNHVSCQGLEKFRSIQEGEIESNKDQESEPTTTTTVKYSSNKESHKGKQSSSHTKTENDYNNNNNQGKRKAKVDWTPELHRRFVLAVEKLGVEKAVPSRILELMGIETLTRHNIASHLQKYRLHRKHLLSREAEAVKWTSGGGKGGGSISPWHPPTIMGFSPMTNMHHHHHHPFRPLHVRGHPTAPSMDLGHGRMPMWPNQVVPSPCQPPTWPSPVPQPSSSPTLWHLSHHHRFTAAPVPGIPPYAMYRPGNANVSSPPPGPQSTLSSHPSNERMDTAIGDVLAKPWLPLPIGLKPPSADSVLVELQRQGIPKIPPSCPSFVMREREREREREAQQVPLNLNTCPAFRSMNHP